MAAVTARRQILALGLVVPLWPRMGQARHGRRHAATAPPPVTPDLPDAVRVFENSYREEAAGRIDSALEVLAALPQGDRESYLAVLRRAWLLYRGGRHAEAVAAYAAALAKEPGSIEARLGQLLPRMALKQWPEAEAGAKAVLQADPASYLGGLRLAWAVYNQGRFWEAEQLYRRTLARYPSDADLRAGVAWSLLRLGKRTEATQMFLQALAAAPESAAILEGLRASQRPG
jgi:tetratricopeptide (TPR) repeat protein